MLGSLSTIFLRCKEEMKTYTICVGSALTKHLESETRISLFFIRFHWVGMSQRTCKIFSIITKECFSIE